MSSKSKIKFKETFITPVQAHNWLEELNYKIDKGTFNQRSPSKRAVEKMAADMQSNNFILTHQAIAFDTDNNLIDGRQRLSAIVKAGIPVRMIVATNVPIKVVKNKTTLKTMDLIDSGRNRTLGQVFQQFHNIPRGNLIASILRTVAELVTKRTEAISKAQGFELKSLLEEELELIINATSEGLVERRAFILAPLIIAATIERNKTIEFAERFCAMENIQQGSSILALRKYVTAKTIHSGAARRSGSLATCNALIAYFTGTSVKELAINFEGLNALIETSQLITTAINKILNIKAK